MQTGLMLNREIAEKLGWRIVRTGEIRTVCSASQTKAETLILLRPDGTQYQWAYLEDQLWDWALLAGGEDETGIPYYHKRLDAALSLWPKDSKIVLTRYEDGRWNAYGETPDGRAFERDADAPTVALCYAWLAWQAALDTDT